MASPDSTGGPRRSYPIQIESKGFDDAWEVTFIADAVRPCRWRCLKMASGSTGTRSIKRHGAGAQPGTAGYPLRTSRCSTVPTSGQFGSIS